MLSLLFSLDIRVSPQSKFGERGCRIRASAEVTTTMTGLPTEAVIHPRRKVKDLVMMIPTF
jgi:hypothetical protein